MRIKDNEDGGGGRGPPWSICLSRGLMIGNRIKDKGDGGADGDDEDKR